MRVTLAYPWTDPEGKTLKPGVTVDVDDATAANLIHDGWARAASSSDPKGA